MKNTTLTMSFNADRLDALTYHMGKKEADLQEELKDYLQKLYEKYVPQAMVISIVLSSCSDLGFVESEQGEGSGTGVRCRD